MSRETVADELGREDFLLSRKVESKKWLFCMCVGVARESTSSLLRESVLESLKMVGWLVGRLVVRGKEVFGLRNPVSRKRVIRSISAWAIRRIGDPRRGRDR